MTRLTDLLVRRRCFVTKRQDRGVPRRLQSSEIEALLAQTVPVRLATIDTDGYPHVTPLWFTLDGQAIVMTSYSNRSHVLRAQANPRVGLVIDIEAPLRPDGERPNQQIRIRGNAVVTSDDGYAWTTRIRNKYIDAAVARGAADQIQPRSRSVIRVEPRGIIAVASV